MHARGEAITPKPAVAAYVTHDTHARGVSAMPRRRERCAVLLSGTPIAIGHRASIRAAGLRVPSCTPLRRSPHVQTAPQTRALPVVPVFQRVVRRWAPAAGDDKNESNNGTPEDHHCECHPDPSANSPAADTVTVPPHHRPHLAAPSCARSIVIMWVGCRRPVGTAHVVNSRTVCRHHGCRLIALPACANGYGLTGRRFHLCTRRCNARSVCGNRSGPPGNTASSQHLASKSAVRQIPRNKPAAQFSPPRGCRL